MTIQNSVDDGEFILYAPFVVDVTPDSPVVCVHIDP